MQSWFDLPNWPSEAKAIFIGFVGLGFKAMFRRDVPWWHFAIDAAVILPIAVFIVAPALAEFFELGPAGERAVVFVMGAYGRDIVRGCFRMARMFGADPAAFIWWRK